MRKLILGFICVWFILCMPAHSSASVSVPYKTETLSADGETIETQTAYVPIGLFGKSAMYESPQDLHLHHNSEVYVADSERQLVIRVSPDGTLIREYGAGILQQPSGVYVDHNNDVYVADYQLEKVLRFSEAGELLQEYGRPDSPLFGERSPYKPQKVTVDRRGNLYVVGEGATNGIIQLSNEGSFLGYYGVNRTQESLLSFLAELLTTERQRLNLFLKVPPAPTNITIDEKGMVYSVTQGTGFEAIRKLNIAGGNLLPSDLTDATNLQDVAIGPAGNILSVASNGVITEFDPDGQLLFQFGGREDGSTRAGLFMQPSAIEVDDAGRLFIADSEQGTIQLLEPTAFTRVVHEGITLFSDGFYVESEKHWQEVLKLNSSFGLAHHAIGQAFFKQQHYEEALERFKLAENREGYSDAFWEIRYLWMQENLSMLFAVLIGVFFLRSAVIYTDRKRPFLTPVRKKWRQLKEIRLVDELLFLFRFIRYPIDSFYYLKDKQHVSIVSATILYAIVFVEFVILNHFKGFIFSSPGQDQIHLASELATLFIPIGLFIVTNYLVSTINDGEGRFSDLYIGTAYSLAPFILGILPLTFISRVLTLNEAFVYIFSLQVILIWSGIILFIMVKEVHDFTFWGTVRNLLVTLFGMAIFTLICVIVYILIDQVYQFVFSIIQEVIYRV